MVLLRRLRQPTFFTRDLGFYTPELRHQHFQGRNVAILGHALTKEDKVPKADIERAIRRKKAFEENPAQHSYSEEE